MRLFDARTDSVPVLACIGTCDPEVGDDNFAAAYRGTTKAFERAELDVFCKAALEGASKPLDTRELALHVTVAREWNADDKRPRISIAHGVTRLEHEYAVAVGGAVSPLVNPG